MRPESCRFLLAQPSSHYVPPERAAGPRRRTERGRAAGPVSAGAPRGPPRASAQLFQARELCPRPRPAPAASRLSILVRVTGRLKIPSSLPQACRPLTPCLESIHFATDRRGRGTDEPRSAVSTLSRPLWSWVWSAGKSPVPGGRVPLSSTFRLCRFPLSCWVNLAHREPLTPSVLYS